MSLVEVLVQIVAVCLFSAVDLWLFYSLPTTHGFLVALGILGANLLLTAVLLVARLIMQKSDAPGHSSTELERIAMTLSRTDVLEQMIIYPNRALGHLENQIPFDSQQDTAFLISIRIDDAELPAELQQSHDQEAVLRCYKAVVRFLEKQFHKLGADCYYSKISNDYLILVCMRKNDRMDREVLEKAGTVIDQLREKFLDAVGVEISAAYSNLYRNLQGIPTMYEENNLLLRYKTFLSLSCKNLYGVDYPKEPEQDDPDDAEIRKNRVAVLYQVRDGQYEQAKVTLKAFFQLQFQDEAHITPFTLDAAQNYFVTNFLKARDECLLAYGKQRPNNTQELMSKLLASPTADALLQELLGVLDRVSEDCRSEDISKSTWLDRTIKYIHENYANPDLTAATVSEFADISPSHISRVFQKQYGMGVHDYIQSIRVNHASGLLRSGLVVNEIAKKSGFTSVASMNRAFKKFRGITPAKMNSAQEFKPSVMPESGA